MPETSSWESKVALRVGVVAVATASPGGLVLTAAGVVDSEAASYWAGAIVLCAYWLILASPLLGPGDRDARLLRLCTLWLWVSGITHLTWELSWCLIHARLHGAGESDLAWWLWWVYGVADNRYLASDSFVVPMEWFTSVLGGPLAFYALRLLATGRELRGHLFVIGLSVMELYGTLLYWTTEWANGFTSADPGDPLNFYVKFIGINALWVIFPALSIWVAGRWVLRHAEGPSGRPQ